MVLGLLVVVVAVIGLFMYMALTGSTVQQQRGAEVGRIMFQVAMFAICFHYASALVRL